MKNLKKFVWLFCAILGMTTFVACEEDMTEDYYTIEIGEMSDAYKDNYLLQTCVNLVITEYSVNTSGAVMRTEKNAKEWFDAACNNIQNSWTLINTVITIEPDTWVELQLVNSNNKEIKTKKVKFPELNN